MYLSCTISEKLALIQPRRNFNTDMAVLITINPHTKFEKSSFIYYKDVTKAQNL